MEKRTLGRTGLAVSRLGVGLAEIGELELEEARRAAEVLNAALDNGINFFDTAACYGVSEELIGQTIARRRSEFVLATKAGHVVDGYTGEPWTAQTISDSIDRSLRRMRTDYLDLVQLHTCSVAILERGEVIDALQRAREAGKTRFIGYSGDNEPALWAVESGLFDTLQTSFNLVDQNARHQLFGPARAQNMGIIDKRPIANGAWGAQAAPSDYAAAYYERAKAIEALGPLPEGPTAGGVPVHRIWLALGFALAHDAVDTCIVGTGDPEHMRQNIAWVETLPPVAQEIVTELHHRFDQLTREQSWPQLS